MSGDAPRRFAVETLGCRYNRFETAEIDYELSQAGYVRGAEGEPLDLVVINTCTVTDTSDARCRNAIRKAKQEHPKALVVVAGCYAETNPAEVAAMGQVDLVLGNAEKFDVARRLIQLRRGDAPTVATGGDQGSFMPIRPVTNLAGRTNAYLNVQGGCDEVCSFCVVRLARGRNRSAHPDEAVAQVARIARAGVKEVVLSGINLGDYGRGSDVTLARLLARMVAETPVERIRLSSVNPNTIDDGLIRLMADNPDRICPHLHIPLQSGSDPVLRRMRRPYTAGFYEELIGRIAEAIPGIGLGADALVAFPGETDDEFRGTYELIERAPLTMLHVFTFSPREGTEGWEMRDRTLPKEVAKERAALLKGLSAAKSRAARRREVGKTHPVLVENRRGRDGLLRGFTGNYLPVSFAGPEEAMNRIVPVTILDGEGERLIGETGG